jgi:hypothetical protein
LFCSIVPAAQGSIAQATIFADGHLRCMTQLAMQLAATHDHWFEEAAAKHAFPALKLRWKHLQNTTRSSRTGSNGRDAALSPLSCYSEL